MIEQYFLAFFLTFLLTYITTPIARQIALKLKILDHPANGKIHTDPMPYLGGMAIAISLIFAIIFSFKPLFELSMILALGMIIAIIGLIDDYKPINPQLKLVSQILVASGIYFLGIKVRLFNFWLLDFFITLFWIVGIINALNLLDNMDGLSAGISAIASFFFFLIAALNEQYLVATLSAALCGASLAFLKYNFKPAIIFMGDAGSMFLGLILAVIGIKLRFSNINLITFGVPILVLGVPIFDTTLVTFSRKLKGKSIYEGGKDHCSHRLVNLGLKEWQAVSILYLVAGSLGFLALVLASASLLQAIGILGAIILLGIAGEILFLKVQT